MKKGPLQLPRTYLAGPMTGYEDHNFPAFERYARYLRQHGHTVVNPAELEAMETGPRKSWEYYLKRDLRELLTCDHIAVMPNWEYSRGATLEVYTGWRLGFTIISAEAMETVDVSGVDFSAIQKETEGQTFMRAFDPPKMERELLVAPCATDMGPDYKCPPKESILEEAQRIVGGDRNAAYGGPRQDFDRTAAIWGAILGMKNITAMQVALCMIGVKMSRQCNKIKRDNLVDIAGYARCAELVADSYENDA